jgi:hypothetical protein
MFVFGDELEEADVAREKISGMPRENWPDEVRCCGEPPGISG